MDGWTDGLRVGDKMPEGGRGRIKGTKTSPPPGDNKKKRE
jgi:hypothetical protein